MEPGLVSIVVLCHNNWPDLELALLSALQQTYRPVEVVVVDSDSQDATPRELPSRFGSAICYLRTFNRGLGAAYNVGAAAAHGEFLQFLDGDDFLAPDKVEKQIESFRGDPGADIVYGDFRRFQRAQGPAQWTDFDMGVQSSLLEFMIRTGGGLAGHSVIYRHSAVERVGAWDESLYIPDVDYWLRAASAGLRFRYCPGSLCFYQKRSGQMTANKLAMLRGGEALWAKALTFIRSEPHRSAVAAQLARWQYRRALVDVALTQRQAQATLDAARAGSPQTISLLALGIATLLIWLPGARTVLASPGLGWVKRPLARWAGLGI